MISTILKIHEQNKTLDTNDDEYEPNSRGVVENIAMDVNDVT